MKLSQLTLIVATVTTRTEKKKNQPTHVLVDSNPAFEEPSMILLEQIFTIDKSRIERFMGYASKAEMLRINKVFVRMFFRFRIMRYGIGYAIPHFLSRE